MSHTALWIDHNKACIYQFSGKGIEEKTIQAETKKMDREHQKKFYHNVACALKDAQKIMIMGPGMAKDEFKRHCDDHNHHRVLDEIIGTETMKDHPSKSEVLRKADAFFTHYFEWNGIV